MMEISDKVLTQAGLRPSDDEAEPVGVAGEAFSEDDDAPIDLE
jgi:hypothetical protein